MQPNHNRNSQQPGPYYSQEQYDQSQAQSQYPPPANVYPQSPYYVTNSTTASGTVSPQAYSYAQTYQYAPTSTYPPSPYASSPSTTRGYAAGPSNPQGGNYTYSTPLTSPGLSSPTQDYFSSPTSPSQQAQASYTSPGGTTHTLAENEALLKRLRNTAASARFREKKKQREKSLEEKERDKREELERLEERIRELEAENRFLKGLVWAPAGGGSEEKEEKGKGKEKEKAKE